MAGDALEDECRRRACEGWDELVTFVGDDPMVADSYAFLT
jgi:hypothetical protein